MCLEPSLWPASSLVRIMALLCHRCRNTHPLGVREEHTVARPSPTSRLDVLMTCGAFCCGVMTVVFIDMVMVLLFRIQPLCCGQLRYDQDNGGRWFVSLRDQVGAVTSSLVQVNECLTLSMLCKDVFSERHRRTMSCFIDKALPPRGVVSVEVRCDTLMRVETLISTGIDELNTCMTA